MLLFVEVLYTVACGLVLPELSFVLVSVELGFGIPSLRDFRLKNVDYGRVSKGQ